MLFRHLLPAIADPSAHAAVMLRLVLARNLGEENSAKTGSTGYATGTNILVDEALAAARVARDVAEVRHESWRRVLFLRALPIVIPTWDHEAFPAALELLRLGFPMSAWFQQHAVAADYGELLAHIEHFDEVAQQDILTRSRDLDLPITAFAPLRAHFESWLAVTTDVTGFRGHRMELAATRLAMFDAAESLRWCERMLIEGLAASSIVRTRPNWLEPLRESMFRGLISKDGDARRVTLRSLVVARGEGLEMMRNRAIAWLAFLHDTQVIPLVADAYELGLVECTALGPVDADMRGGDAARGLRWFDPSAIQRQRGLAQQAGGWTGAEIAAIAEPCLESGRREAWQDLGTSLQRHPLPVLQAMLRQFDHSPPVIRRGMLSLPSELPESLVEHPDLRRAFALRGLADADADVARAALGLLVRGAGDLDDERAREGLVRTIGGEPGRARAAIELVGKLGDGRFWDPIEARIDETEVYAAALAALFRIDRQRALETILAWAQRHPDRRDWVVVEYAKPSLDPRFVPLLLDALRSPNADTRNGAREALEAIEFHATYKQRWQRLLDGAGLDAPSAAEALLKQAREAETPRIRLAAIESLGTLAAPETLPFLIDMMRDEDPAIATAAAAAVDRINARE